MDNRFAPALACAALLALAYPATPAPAAPAASPAGPRAADADPLADEMARWSAFLKDTTSTDDLWTQVKDATAPVMERAEKALHDGRRLLALNRFAAARMYLAAFDYLQHRTADERKGDAGFEAEWARFGKKFHKDLGPPRAGALDGATPAAVRGIGEAALNQVRGYYDASLEYGRNTMPDQGFFYIGSAQAQKDFASFCRSLRWKTAGRPPRLRSLTQEIDALEHDLLAAYRPPVSIDRHHEFIVAHATLKEAREMDDAGLRHGALLRYLDAARLALPLRAAQTAPDPQGIAARLRSLEERMDREDVDHSIGRLFLESARADLEPPPADTGPVTASAIASDVLPRYFAALEAPPPAAPRHAPRVTVTLVRWPYT